MTVRFPYDVYVLARGRTRESVDRFTREWLQGFEPAAEEYELPQFAQDPVAVYHVADELIDVLLKRLDEPYAIYWSNTGEGEVRTAVLAFTADGALIAGLHVDGGRDDAVRYLERLAKTVDGRFGYLTGEEPPPDTATELVELVRAARPALVDGVVRS